MNANLNAAQIKFIGNFGVTKKEQVAISREGRKDRDSLFSMVVLNQINMNKNVTEYALSMLRYLPRVCLGNIRDNPGAVPKKKRGRGQHGGDKHGAGNKGSGQRQNFMRIGYETGNNPFYLRFPMEPYYKGHHLRREYPPLSLLNLQKLIDTNRVDPSKPIDVTCLCNTGLMTLLPDQRQCGFQLTDEGADIFKAKVNIEVQWASEPAVAAIERNGGVITVAYFDMMSLLAAVNPPNFFKKAQPIPRRMLPHNDDLALYYSDPSKRGYLADPEKVSWERFVLAQKYGYSLPHLEDDPDFKMLTQRKDPRQVFYGLEPGWIINVKDKIILKPKSHELENYYKS